MIPLPRAALFCIQDTASIVKQKRRVTGSTPVTESLHAKEEQKTQHAATVCAARCKGQRSALNQPPQRIAFSGSLLCRMLSFPFQRTTTRTDVHEEPCCQGSFSSFEEAASGSTISVRQYAFLFRQNETARRRLLRHPPSRNLILNLELWLGKKHQGASLTCGTP